MTEEVMCRNCTGKGYIRGYGCQDCGTWGVVPADFYLPEVAEPSEPLTGKTTAEVVELAVKDTLNRPRLSSAAAMLMAEQHIHVTYADHPETIGELRADRNDGGPSDWSPRDVLIQMLRDIDSGRAKPTDLAIVWRGNGEHGSKRAGKDTIVAIGLLTAYAQEIGEWYNGNSVPVPPPDKSA